MWLNEEIVSEFSDHFLTSLAGNAFDSSCYTVALLAALAALGADCDLLQADAGDDISDAEGDDWLHEAMGFA
jgi:hypothetical protein